MAAKTIEGFVDQGVVDLRRNIVGGRGRVLYRLNEDVKVVCFSVDRVRLPEDVSTTRKLPAAAKVESHCLEVLSFLINNIFRFFNNPVDKPQPVTVYSYVIETVHKNTHDRRHKS